MKSLLQQAKSLDKRKVKKINKDIIAVSVAWAKDEITYSQVASVLNTTGSGTYITIAKSLKQYIQHKLNK